MNLVYTKTRWILRYSTVHNFNTTGRAKIRHRGARVSFATTVLCQHTNYGKGRRAPNRAVASDVPRTPSKGCGCNAFIKVRVKAERNQLEVDEIGSPLTAAKILTTSYRSFRISFAGREMISFLSSVKVSLSLLIKSGK